MRGLFVAGLLVALGAGLSATASARSPRVRVNHLGRSSRGGKLHALPHAVALHDMAPILEPGVVPEPDAPLPDDGQKYMLHLAAMHRDDSIDIVYRIGDTYVPSALAELNNFLRDHRTEEVTEYDPREFDLLHNLLARLGKPGGTVDIVCGYRSPETNALLREDDPGTGVAEHSQHIEGRAIDIRVPGVSTATLRNAALSLNSGGVGYYPRSQFVHVDVGPVRTWTWGGRASRVRGKRRAHGTKVRRRRG